jgi:hypothetical protein
MRFSATSSHAESRRSFTTASFQICRGRPLLRPPARPHSVTSLGNRSSSTRRSCPYHICLLCRHPLFYCIFHLKLLCYWYHFGPYPEVFSLHIPFINSFLLHMSSTVFLDVACMTTVFHALSSPVLLQSSVWPWPPYFQFLDPKWQDFLDGRLVLRKTSTYTHNRNTE